MHFIRLEDDIPREFYDAMERIGKTLNPRAYTCYWSFTDGGLMTDKKATASLAFADDKYPTYYMSIEGGLIEHDGMEVTHWRVEVTHMEEGKEHDEEFHEIMDEDYVTAVNIALKHLQLKIKEVEGKK